MRFVAAAAVLVVVLIPNLSSAMDVEVRHSIHLGVSATEADYDWEHSCQWESHFGPNVLAGWTAVVGLRDPGWQWLSLEAGAMVKGRGGESELAVTVWDTTGNTASGTLTTEFRAWYVTVPVLLRIQLPKWHGGKLAPYLKAGPEFSMTTLGSTEKETRLTPDWMGVEDQTEDVEGSTRWDDYGLFMAVGVEFPIKSLSCFAEVNYYHGFVDIWTSDWYEEATLKYRAAALEFGFFLR
jgi:hypothetical protein